MTRKYNKNKRINNLTIKTRGSFYSFIDADVNTEFGGEKKGIHVKLEKDDNGKPYAWLIGGEAYWDSTFDALKKGAKGGRYKKFIYELLKMDPQFNSFTRPNVGKGIKISHAMFCKLFAPNSTLGQMYPKLVAKMKKRNYCQSTYAKPIHAPIPAAAPAAVPTAVPAAVPADAPAAVPAPIPAAVPADAPMIDVPAPIPAAAHMIDVPVPVPDPDVIDVPVPVPDVIDVPRISYKLRDTIPYAKSGSIPYAKPGSIPYAKPASVSIPYNNTVSIPGIYHGKPHKSSVKRRQQNPRRISAPELQHNLIILTHDMGFNPFKAKHALIKHGNNIDLAIDELITESSDTRNERSTYPHFETTILIFNLKYRMHFKIKDNRAEGNCLFYSLHEILIRAKPAFKETAHNIRVHIVDFVMNNLGYKNQMTQQTFDDALKYGVMVNGYMLYKKDYVREMKKSGTFGTELEISAASQLYGINIYVVNKAGISFDQLYIGDGYPNQHNTCYIFNYNNTHYTSLIPH